MVKFWYLFLKHSPISNNTFKKENDNYLLTRALLGLWIFHRLLGGGGGV